MKRIILGLFFSIKAVLPPQPEARIIEKAAEPLGECSTEEGDLDEVEGHVKFLLAAGL